MKFRNISGGRVALPTLGIGNVEPGEEINLTGEAAKAVDSIEGFERTDKPGGRESSGGNEPTGDTEEGT